MIYINKNNKNMIDKRVIYLKKIPSDEEFNRIFTGKNSAEKREWTSIKCIKFNRIDNQIIISREQGEESTVLNIVDFITAMHNLSNIDKLVYTVKNEKLNIEATVWDEYIYPKKQGYTAVKKSVVRIDDKNLGKKLYSIGAEDDGTYTTVNGVAFPSCCVIKDGLLIIEQLEADGTLPKPVTWTLKEMNIDLDNIIAERNPKPEIIYSNEIMIQRKDGFTAYIPIADSAFDDVVKKHLRQTLILDNSCRISTVDLNNEETPVLTVAKDKNAFSIGIINEANGVIYYYNNGDKSKKHKELDGESYPKFMITNDIDLVLSVFKYFIESGKPFPKVQWVTEEI